MTPSENDTPEDPDSCWCCGVPAPNRAPWDPWEGRLDGYCDDCAEARCDAYPRAHWGANEGRNWRR
mgnify:CR=1 FL=1